MFNIFPSLINIKGVCISLKVTSFVLFRG